MKVFDGKFQILNKNIKFTHVEILNLKFEPKIWKTEVCSLWLKMYTSFLDTLYAPFSRILKILSQMNEIWHFSSLYVKQRLYNHNLVPEFSVIVVVCSLSFRYNVLHQGMSWGRRIHCNFLASGPVQQALGVTNLLLLLLLLLVLCPFIPKGSYRG